MDNGASAGRSIGIVRKPLTPEMALALTFTAVLAAMLNVRIGAVTVLATIAVCGVMILLRPVRAIRIAARGWPMALFPGLALLSAFWSEAPELTLRYGIQYLLTLTCGLLLAGMAPGRALAKGMAGAFITYSLIAIVAGIVAPSGGAFLGLAASKNIASLFAALAMIGGLSLLLAGEARAERWAGAAGLAIGIGTLLAARSAGTTVAGFVAAGLVLLLGLVGRRSRLGAIGAVGGIGVSATIGTVALGDRLGDAIDYLVVHALGKDSSLTGRTDLWKTANAEIAERPWFGQGYEAFWRHGNMPAESIWTRYGIEGRSGFNFHNSFLEIQVGLGQIGLAVFLIAMIACIAFATYAYLQRGGPAVLMLLGIAGLFVVRMSVETMMIMPNDLSSLLFAILFGYGLTRFREIDVSAPVPGKEPVYVRPVRKRAREAA